MGSIHGSSGSDAQSDLEKKKPHLRLHKNVQASHSIPSPTFFQKDDPERLDASRLVYPKSSDTQGIFGMDPVDAKVTDSYNDQSWANNQRSGNGYAGEEDLLTDHHINLQRGKRLRSSSKSDHEVAKSWQRRFKEVETGFAGLSSDTPAVRIRKSDGAGEAAKEADKRRPGS
ncbi:MAG: hypothetical protein M1828_004795 [Chrysothrix sp. TS-e1954]|nr:MAG: hypothetical protein M1828_004795 [Chrysothrix sp. TS-e1954]